MSDVNPKKMKVDELRKELSKRDLDVAGKKQDLIERLELALDEELLGEGEIKPAAVAVAIPSSPKKSDPLPEKRVVTETKKTDPAVVLSEEEEKIRKRALRFGLPDPVAEKVRLRERALRFGIVDPEIEKEKIKKRKERFAAAPVNPEEAEKRRKRAERFAAAT